MGENTSIIFGIRTLTEAINSGKSIEKVYLQKGLQGNLYSELYRLIKQNNIAFSFVPIEKLEKLSKFQNHQGVVARISPIRFVTIEELMDSVSDKSLPLFLLLDGITDVRNFGAIIRTAECTGVDGIIISKTGNAPVSAAGIKASSGAAFKVPICKVAHIKDALFYLQAAGIQILASTEKTDKSLYETPLNQPLAIILGSEERGIRFSVLKLANYKAKLPLLGTVASLNVSVACGAILYEVLRQRGNY